MVCEASSSLTNISADWVLLSFFYLSVVQPSFQPVFHAFPCKGGKPSECAEPHLSFLPGEQTAQHELTHTWRCVQCVSPGAWLQRIEGRAIRSGLFLCSRKKVPSQGKVQKPAVCPVVVLNKQGLSKTSSSSAESSHNRHYAEVALI